MNVGVEILVGCWHVELDDVGHIGDVQAARSDVGSHQNTAFAVAKRCERGFALALRPVAVDGLGARAEGVPELRLQPAGRRLALHLRGARSARGASALRRMRGVIGECSGCTERA